MSEYTWIGEGVFTLADFLSGDECHELNRTFDRIRDYLAANAFEGIVWHHPDGRLVKIKSRDFGLKRSKI